MTQINADGERDRQTHAVIGAAMAVHNEPRHGFLEPVYQEALEREFVERAIPYERERAFPIFYHGRALLLNFGGPRLDYRRLAFNLRPSASSADLRQAAG